MVLQAKLARVVFAWLLIACPFQAYGVTIEGYTPSGQFKTVGLSANGELKVSATFSGNTSSTTVTNSGVSQATVCSQATPTLIYPADPNRKQGCLNNFSDQTTFAVVAIGNSSVTVNTGFILNAGSYYCPDNPDSMTGAIYAVLYSSPSDGCASTSFIYQQ